MDQERTRGPCPLPSAGAAAGARTVSLAPPLGGGRLTGTASSLAIGDFSRATHLNVKTLRHYHRIGLLEPAYVAVGTGHRRYGTDQIPVAQVIRRLRSLDMPLEEIRAVVSASDLTVRNELIAGHLSRLETTLARTQQAVAALRDVLAPPDGATPLVIEHRRVPATRAAVVSEVIDIADMSAWFRGALAEVRAVLADRGMSAGGRGGGVYAPELFSRERGLAVVFVPCDQPLWKTGRVATMMLPEVELAVATHFGGRQDVDFTYGALASYVAGHALAVDGPFREYYLVGAYETTDEEQWCTEIGWPIFHTGHTTSRASNRPLDIDSSPLEQHRGQGERQEAILGASLPSG